MGSVRTICVGFLLWCLLGIVFTQGDVKICPAEPSLPAGAPCPPECTSCDQGICRISNPLSDVVCPDSMPCRVVCESFGSIMGLPCNQINIKCSPKASCDVMFLRRTGYSTAVDCGNTTHSCNVYCDSISTMGFFRCNSTSSCNCGSNCQIFKECIPGFNCIGDVCFRANIQACEVGLRDGVMVPILDTQGACNCTCTDPNQIIISYPGQITRYCVDPAAQCTSNAECGPHGWCNDFPKICQCILPWGGPKCETNMCPQCQNSAMCGNTTETPCICTGHWQGVNCTEPIPIIAPSSGLPREDRCNASALVPFAAPDALAPITSIPCPSVCTFCETDSDGTPVCLIRLPPPGTFLIYTTQCPDTHRCIGYCLSMTDCWGTLSCGGDLACDLVVLEPEPYASLNCTSSSICRRVCGPILGSRLGAPVRGTAFACGYPGGACICGSDNCIDVPPCIPGISCNGDKCASLTCKRWNPINWSPEEGCFCDCMPHQHRAGSSCFLIGSNILGCNTTCKNGGICRQSKCWCPPGYSGPDCSQRDECVTVSTSTTCPTDCSWCAAGVCFFDLGSTVGVCPPGWPCVFICFADFCDPNELGGAVACSPGAGPCQLWCWGYTFTEFGFSVDNFNEFRPYGACTMLKMICAPGSLGCTARCEALPAEDPYKRANTLRSLSCDDVAVNFTSTTPVSQCAGSCGTDSCYIANADPCYAKAGWQNYDAMYGYLPGCGTDYSGKYVQLAPDFDRQMCNCSCGSGYEMRNGSCSAVGCDPPCQNLGVCISGSNSTFFCRCFGGWNGKDCTSRCFFPVTANVTLCDKGLYRISGELKLPSNSSVDLYKDVPDLERLEVEGSVRQEANSTLSVTPSPNLVQSGTLPTIDVRGNWSQQAGSKLSSSITVSPSGSLNIFSMVYTAINVDGEADLQGGQYELLINGSLLSEIIANSGMSNFTITIMQYGGLLSQFDSVVVRDSSPLNNGCATLRTTPQYSQSGPKGSLNVAFTLDRSTCQTPNDAAASVAAIAAGVVVPVVAIGVAASIAIWKRHKLTIATKALMVKMRGIETLSADPRANVQTTSVSSAATPATATTTTSTKLNWVRASRPDPFDNENL